MTFLPLYELLPEIAEKETRTITILEKFPGMPPPGNYSLIELFCAENDCDCRNVMIIVFHAEDERQVAHEYLRRLGNALCMSATPDSVNQRRERRARL
jgi:hypothetical protein